MYGTLKQVLVSKICHVKCAVKNMQSGLTAVESSWFLEKNVVYHILKCFNTPMLTVIQQKHK